MERRREPRFEVSSPVRVIVPGEPARMFSARLIDISATGMRFLSEENIEENKIAGIEVDHRLILAEIRHVETRGNKFVVGARRLHEISKDAALGDAPGVVSRMLGDFHRHITDGQKFDSDAVVLAAMEKIMEGKEESWPETLAPPPTAEPAPVAAVTEPPSPAPIITPLAMATEEVLEEQAAQETLAPPPAEEIVEPEPAPAPMMAGSAHARVVDVTPTPVDPMEAARASAINTFDAIQKSIPDARRRERWNLLLAVTAALLFAAVIGALVVERWMQASPATPPARAAAAPQPAPAPAREPPAAAPSPAPAPAAEPSAAAPSPAPAPAREPPAAAPSPAPAPAAEPSAAAPSPAPAPSAEAPATSAPSPVQHAQVRDLKQTWVTIAVDGRAYFNAVLEPGEVREFEFKKNSIVVVGKGDNVVLTLNGSRVTVGSGPRKVRLTPAGAESHKAL